MHFQSFEYIALHVYVQLMTMHSNRQIGYSKQCATLETVYLVCRYVILTHLNTSLEYIPIASTLAASGAAHRLSYMMHWNFKTTSTTTTTAIFPQKISSFFFNHTIFQSVKSRCSSIKSRIGDNVEEKSFRFFLLFEELNGTQRYCIF